jgi:hypothetical protein
MYPQVAVVKSVGVQLSESGGLDSFIVPGRAADAAAETKKATKAMAETETASPAIVFFIP